MTTVKLYAAGLLPAPRVRVTSALLLNPAAGSPAKVRVMRAMLYPEAVAPPAPRIKVSQALLYPATAGPTPGQGVLHYWNAAVGTLIPVPNPHIWDGTDLIPT